MSLYCLFSPNYSGEDTLFSCYHGGHWIETNGVIVYEGGEVLTIEGQAQELFPMLMANSSVNLYRQRVWYKLRYEELRERKELCNGDLNFQRMCSAAMWTKAVDVFMVVDGSGSNVAADDGEETIGGKANDVINDAEQFSECGNDYVNYDVSNDDGQFPEEARVNMEVAGFVDEEENDDYMDTPLDQMVMQRQPYIIGLEKVVVS